MAAAASSGATTITKPIPMLKVRRISASSTAAARWMAAKIGGEGHARGSIRARRPAGSTRGRFSVMPPPVMWAIARTRTSRISPSTGLT